MSNNGLEISNWKSKIFPLQSGQMLVELLIAIGLAAVLLPALTAGFVASRSGKVQENKRMQAIALLKQSEEAVESVKNYDWTSFAVDGTYHAVVNGAKWSLVSGFQTINGFTQEIVIGDVYRDNSDTIVTSGGTLDPSTKLITLTIAWSQPYSSSITASLYLTRSTDLTYTQTSVDDFNAGILTNTSVTNNSGGEVMLSNIANADWCKPQNYIVNQLTLPKLSTAIYALQGGVYLGAGDGTNSQAFINIAINTPPPPVTPSAAISGSFNGTFTTNAIYSDGRYVYLATNNATQIIILDVSHTPYAEIGSVTLPGGQAANGVYVSGNILFATSGNSLYSFDITIKTGSHTSAKSSVQMLAGIWAQPTARQVVVVNNQAYVGTGNSLLGLQAFTFNSDGSNLRFYAAALLTFSQQSQGLYVDPAGHYAYMAFNNANGLSFTKGMVVIDLTKTSWFLIKYYNTDYTYNTNGMDPRGVTVPNTVPAANRAIVVGVGGTDQYQVVDTSNLSNMTQCGGLPVTNGVYGVSSILDQYSNAYSYIITGETGNQFKIIEGGQGGGGYVSSGTFESSTFAPSYQSAFNRFVADINQPVGTTIQMQVAVAPAVNNDCTGVNFTYVGPNGDASEYFTPSGTTILGTIPFGMYSPNYQNPALCYRYKVWFTTNNSAQSPTLYDITTNYSP